MNIKNFKKIVSSSVAVGLERRGDGHIERGGEERRSDDNIERSVIM